MSFIVYDIVLLIFFAVFIGLFLYMNRRNLKKEGLLFLYKATWGIRLIDLVGKKYKKTLHFLSYISIGLGYFLMATMIYLFVRIVYIYLAFPSVVRAIKVPPIIPLVPYLPQLFKLDFLPEFYFTYWIFILAIIAVSHEFAHGIFASSSGVKIKSTGFGFFPFFLPVFLAAFVELDEDKMAKKSKFTQMAVLSAGTFANVLTAIFFFAILIIFFSLMFTPAGVVFNSYATSIVPVEKIDSIDGVALIDYSYEEIFNLVNPTEPSKILVGGTTFVGVSDFSSDGTQVRLYHDAPAINAKLNGAIIEINNIKILNPEELIQELTKYDVGEKITIKTKSPEGVKDYELTLEKNPHKDSSWIGVGFKNVSGSGVLGRVYSLIGSFKDSHVYYEPKFDGWSEFTYDLLWWLVLISFSVALVNMLPVGIFDGGRFFYLTVWGITKSEKIAKRSFAFVTYFFLLLLALIMVFWAWSFFR